MTNFLDLPDNLPIPQDDGAASHLDGTKLISIPLHATDNSQIDLSKMSGTTVVFIYPMSGVPGVELPIPRGAFFAVDGRGCDRF